MIAAAREPAFSISTMPGIPYSLMAIWSIALTSSRVNAGSLIMLKIQIATDLAGLGCLAALALREWEKFENLTR